MGAVETVDSSLQATLHLVISPIITIKILITAVLRYLGLNSRSHNWVKHRVEQITESFFFACDVVKW